MSAGAEMPGAGVVMATGLSAVSSLISSEASDGLAVPFRVASVTGSLGIVEEIPVVPVELFGAAVVVDLSAILSWTTWMVLVA